MGAKFDVPDKAIREAAHWMKVRQGPGASEEYWRLEMAQMLPYAARLIVAAELDRLADEMDSSPAAMPVTSEDVRARASERAWVLLTDFPSPEDITTAAELIAAAALDRVAPDLNCVDDYQLLIGVARELRGEV